LAIWLVTGAPSNLIGNNGDLAIRQDAPGGIYGPKVGGSWPADPLPGTSYSQISDFLDFLGTTQGDIVYRGASAWEVLTPGTAGQVLQSGGAAANPSWTAQSSFVLNSAAVDAAFGNTQGDILVRNATVWTVLGPGTAGQVLQSGGAGADLSWVSPSSFTLNSAAVDAAFGATVGGVLTRGAGGWVNSGVGASSQVLMSQGAGLAPSWFSINVVLDNVFGSTQGNVLYRGASAWAALAPGVNGQFLQTAGPGANPVWATSVGLTPGSIGSYGISSGGTPLDGSLNPYPGVWVAVSYWSQFVPDDAGGPGTTVQAYLMQRVS
jgi:hypothetical protein